MKKGTFGKLSSQLTVLIVDSAQESRSEITQAFLECGLKAISVNTGAEAFDVICWMRSPVLAIIDIILPDMSGLELATRLKRERAIPIVITGYQAEPHLIAGLLDLIADDFVRKPFDPRELAARVLRILQSNPNSILAQSKKRGAEPTQRMSAGRVSAKLAH